MQVCYQYSMQAAVSRPSQRAAIQFNAMLAANPAAIPDMPSEGLCLEPGDGDNRQEVDMEYGNTFFYVF